MRARGTADIACTSIWRTTNPPTSCGSTSLTGTSTTVQPRLDSRRGAALRAGAPDASDGAPSRALGGAQGAAPGAQTGRRAVAHSAPLLPGARGAVRLLSVHPVRLPPFARAGRFPTSSVWSGSTATSRRRRSSFMALRRWLPRRPSAFGEGPAAFATAVAVAIMRPALKALSHALSRAELRRKHTASGHPKNYAVVARRPATSDPPAS